MITVLVNEFFLSFYNIFCDTAEVCFPAVSMCIPHCLKLVKEFFFSLFLQYIL